MGAAVQGQPVSVREVHVSVGRQRHATGKLRRATQMAARGASGNYGSDQGQQGSGQLQHAAPSGLIWPGYRQVSVGLMDRAVDADHADRLDDHRVG